MMERMTLKDLPQTERPRERLGEAGKIMGIEVHDHVIMAGTKYTSLKVQKLICRRASLTSSNHRL